MEILWAPWRLSYVTAAKTPEPDDPCFICQGLAADDEQDKEIRQSAEKIAALLKKRGGSRA